MLLLFFWPAGRYVRVGLALYTLAMGFALVYGGEHYVTDILAGWVMAVAVHAVVQAAAAPVAALATRLRTRVRFIGLLDDPEP
jgi:membrane-associated phospholipid phosphatase